MSNYPRKSLEAIFLSTDHPFKTKRKIVIHGTDDLAKVAFEDISEFLEGDEIIGLMGSGECPSWYPYDEPIVDFSAKGVLELFDKRYTDDDPTTLRLFLSIGYKHMNESRQAGFGHCRSQGLGEPMAFLHPKSNISRSAIISSGVWIRGNCNVDADSSIGEGTIMWSSSHVGHSTKIGKHNWITTGSVICDRVITGDRCFFAANSCVSPGVVLPDATMVGLGAKITKSPQEAALAFGDGVNQVLTDDKGVPLKSWEVPLK